MSTEIRPATYGALRAASTSGGGSALTTTPIVVAVPPGTTEVQIIPRNFSTAVAVQMAICPYLTVLKTTDSLAAVANTTDYSSQAQDGDTGTDVTLSSLATSHALWVGSDLPFRGLQIDVDGNNTAAAVLTGTYWNGTTMADISLTDNTDATGATLVADGSVTWTVPTDWAKATLRSIASAHTGIPDSGQPRYWVKLVVDGALDAAVTLNSLLALCRSTAYAELSAGAAFEMGWESGPGAHGGIEFRTDAGTANVIVNAAVRMGARFL